MVRVVKHENIDEKRNEFLLVNFDYSDGSDYIAKMFCQKFKMKTEEKLDGFWFTIIKLYSEDSEYGLVWHEDTGNAIYSVAQDEESILILEQRLAVIVEELNQRIENHVCK